MASGAFYDDIGRSYTATRQEDPKLAAAIWAALGDGRSVLNVGAGTGSYEPRDRDVLALEPSEVMIAQRPEGAAPVIKGNVEAIPLRDDSVDVAMAVLSDHHWRDRLAGMGEMRRVARRRVVLFTADPGEFAKFWFVPEYLPEYVDLIPPRYREAGVWERELRMGLGMIRLEPVAIPHDCLDGFFGAYWRRPEAYFDETVRAGISVFARVPAAATERALAALSADLDSGTWHERHAHLLELEEIDLGYRLVIAELK
ncbi:MAG TPA: methyltransferase domain-containing protein [Thermoleophilaceae bacterium]